MTVSRSFTPVALVVLATGLSACDGPPSDAGNQAVGSTNMTAPTPAPAQPLLLTAYIGRYPGDPVDGIAFREARAVRDGVEKRLGKNSEVGDWVLGAHGPNTPVFVKDGMVQSWGCEAHNCSDRNWTVQIDQVSGDAAICYHEAVMGENKARWYLPDGTETMRDGACPSEA